MQKKGTAELLWAKYTESRDLYNRNCLVEHFMFLVSQEAHKISSHLRPTWTLDDIKSPAYDGLIRAVEKYDQSKGIKFETYARFRIRGAIKDWQREMDILGRQTRNKKKKHQLGSDFLTKLKGITPTTLELSQYLNIPENVIIKDIELFKIESTETRSTSLVDKTYNNFIEMVEQQETSSEDIFDSKLCKELLNKICNDEEKTIVEMRIMENKSFIEIAETVGKSYSWVRLKLPKIINKLKQNLHM